MEELFWTLFGLAMIYSMVHSTVIIFQKTKGLTSYERIILWVGFATLVFMLLGILYS